MGSEMSEYRERRSVGSRRPIADQIRIVEERFDKHVFTCLPCCRAALSLGKPCGVGIQLVRQVRTLVEALERTEAKS